MPHTPSTAPSTFVWYELTTSDAPAACAFYQAVFGWSLAAGAMPELQYTLASVGSTEVAGLMAIPPAAASAGARPCWTGYISVPDVDAHAQRVTQAGGMLYVPPTDIPGIGRFAIVADPQGADFALFTGLPVEPPAQPPAGTPGTFGWNELHAMDDSAAFALYADLFGWTPDQAMDMGPLGTYQLFAADGVAIGGMMRRADGGRRATWLYYLYVEQIEAAAERVRAHGGKTLEAPSEVPGGLWIVPCTDPQGAAFALLGSR